MNLLPCIYQEYCDRIGDDEATYFTKSETFLLVWSGNFCLEHPEIHFMSPVQFHRSFLFVNCYYFLNEVEMQHSDLRGDPEPALIPSVWETFNANVREHSEHVAISCLHQPGGLYGLKSQILHDEPEYMRNQLLRWTYHTLFEGLSRLIRVLESKGLDKGAPFFTFVANGVESSLWP
jgi:hypothetical protein